MADKLTIPTAQVEQYLRWWNEQKRTPGWAERYGGKFEQVEQLLTDSDAALKEERERQAREEIDKRNRRRTFLAVVGALSVLCVILGIVGIVQFSRASAALVSAQDEHRKADDARNTATEQSLKAASNYMLAGVMSSIAGQRSRETAVANIKLKASNANLAGEVQIANNDTALAQRSATKARESGAAAAFQSGRQAWLNGEDKIAAQMLTQAVRAMPGNVEAQALLAQALHSQAMQPQAKAIDTSPSPITALRFNPNPHTQQYATGDAAGSLKLWTASGRLIHDFGIRRDIVTAIAYDPSGRYLAAVHRDGSAELHDLSGIGSGGSAAAIILHSRDGTEGHAARINSVAFSHAGDLLVTAGLDDKVYVWQTRSGLLFEKVSASKPSTAFYDAAFLPGDRQVAVAEGDGTLSTFDVASGAGELRKIDGLFSKAALLHLAINGTANRLAAAGADGSGLLYNLAQSKHITAWGTPSGATVNAIAFNPRGTQMLAGGQDGIVRIYDATTGSPIRTLVRPNTGSAAAAVTTAAFAPNDNGIITGYADGWVTLWSLTGQRLATVGGTGSEIGSADFLRSGRLYATADAGGHVRVWRPLRVMPQVFSRHRASIDSISFDAKGDRFVTGSEDGTAAVWRLAPSPVFERRLVHSTTDWVAAAQFSADGSAIVTAGGNTAKTWSVQGRQLGERRIPKDDRFSAAQFVGGQHTVVLTDRALETVTNPSIQYEKWSVWPLDLGHVLQHEGGYQPQYTALQVSGDGLFLLTLSTEENGLIPGQSLIAGYALLFSLHHPHQRFSIWNVSSAQLARHSRFFVAGADNGTLNLVTFTPSASMIVSSKTPGNWGRAALGLSSDDRWLASAGARDHIVRIWKVSASGSTLRLLRTRDGREPTGVLGDAGSDVTSLSFSPGSAALVLAISSDGEARLWDRVSGDFLGTIPVPRSNVVSGGFTPNGVKPAIILGAADGTLYYWALQSSPAGKAVVQRVR